MKVIHWKDMNVDVTVELEIILSVFEMQNSGYSGYTSAHAYKCTRVVQSRTFRVINKMATTYGY